MHTRYFDDFFLQATDAGVRQAVTLADLGAQLPAQRRTIAIDLREDWPAALVDTGFDTGKPTAWSAESLLVYLPPEAQDRLFDNVAAMSAPGSRIADFSNIPAD